jgi:hypothetical protein
MGSEDALGTIPASRAKLVSAIPLLLALSVALAARDAGSSTLVVPEGSFVAAYTESGSDTVFPPTPSVASATYSFGGAASATRTSYDVTDPDAAIGLDFRHTHDPSGSYGPFLILPCDPFCAGSRATIVFEVTSPVLYALSGAYAVSDEAGRMVSFSLHLLDVTSDTELFGFDDASSGVPNASFSVGPAAGTLAAGRQYELTLAADLSSSLEASGLAAASGFVEISFSPVPEVGTALLVGLGLGGLIAARGRRRS